MLDCRAHPEDRAKRSAYERARSQYEAVCEHVLRFFDAQLKGQSGPFVATICDRPPPGAGPHPYLIHVPRGAAGAEPYRTDSPIPPTARQIRELMGRLGVEPTLELLKRHHKTSPSAAVFHRRLAMAIVDELLELERVRDAIAVKRVYAELDPETAFSYRKMGLSFEGYGMKEHAMSYFRKALLLDPSDAEAAEHLKKLKESMPPPPAR